MTAKTTDDKPATEYLSLAAALAAFQRALPTVEKGAKGQVRGNPNYKYADLADLNGVVLPELGSFGLSFSCKPTLNAAGRFVLAYTLRHESGGEDAGEYPLPDDVSPQDMGSAQSYARRYVLQAMTGVAPVGQDDDGAAATRAYSHRGTNDQQPRNGAQNGRQAPEPPAAGGGDPVAARGGLAVACEQNGWDLDIVADLFQSEHGTPLGLCTDALVIAKFRTSLFTRPQAELMKATSSNGAPAATGAQT